MNILVTGGAGYIGTHVVVELVNSGHCVFVLDNLSNSSETALNGVETIIGEKVHFFNCDIRDRESLKDIFDSNEFDCCIHLAGLKAVGESTVKPWEYYDNNVAGTITLLDVMREHNCKNIIFSSSATVYGQPDIIPIPETHSKKECTNPYGKTKSIIEDLLIDYHNSDMINKVDEFWNIVLLRYFNPIGAHPSGLIGENPKGVSNNLMPCITQVASGKLDHLKIYGNDYDTPDGTGIRDFIHVVDLAKGHVKALSAIERNCGVQIYNLGTGKGYSVLDLVKTFEAVNDVKVPYKFVERRLGDIAVCYANPNKAKEELGWTAEYEIKDMCRDSWKWQKGQF